MEKKEIILKEKFQKDVLEAADLLAKPVCATLGPGGLPILLDRNGYPPLLTKDGVTVANSIFVTNPEQDAIIQTIKEAALKTNKVAGDGTTCSILLAYALIKESQKYLQSEAINPQRLGKELLQIEKQLSIILDSMSNKINDDLESIKSIAKISANGDEEISSLVVQAIDAVGVDGFVTLQESPTFETELKIQDGFAIANGYGSIGPQGVHWINNKVMQEVVYKNPYVFMIDGNVDNTQEFFACLGNFTCGEQKDMSIIVLAYDFSPVIILGLLQNLMAGRLRALPIKIPKLGAQYSQSEVLEDIALLTGGKVFKPGIHRVKDTESDPDNKRIFLGKVDSLTATRRETVLYKGHGDKEKITERADQLKSAMNDAFTEWEKNILQQRLGRLVGGVAVIHIGGPTELEIKERKDRTEDALRATRVALEEGVVIGGGVALLSAWNQYINLNNIYDSIPHDIFARVIRYPFKIILENLGLDDYVILEFLNVIMNKLKNDEKSNCGFNGYTMRLVDDMVKDGIIDPTKVVKSALQNAVSIAALLLSSGGGVICKTKKKEEIRNSEFEDPVDNEI